MSNDYRNDRDEQEERWNAQYAEYLDQQMEAQYHAEIEARYLASLEADHLAAIERTEAGQMKRREKIIQEVESESLAHQLLHLELGPNDAQAATVGEYLGLLLSTLWLEAEGFSSKRPFGESGWQYVIYIAMGKAGMTEITLDEDGYVEEFTEESELAANEIILQAIRLTYDHG